MQKALLLLACVCALFISCKKSSSTPVPVPTPDGISAMIDGANVTFNTSVTASITESGGIHNLAVVGFKAEEGNSDLISIEVNGDKAAGIGTYDWPLTGSSTLMPVLSYNEHTGGNVYVDDAAGVHPVTVSITSLSATSVSGTFSGTIVLTTGSSSTTQKVITNGKFTATIR
jgi:hypothetical protein